MTARAAFALTDGRASELYGAALPDFAALGYTRRAGVNGWWVELGRFERSVDASGLPRAHHGSAWRRVGVDL